jgi:hypothetical protein
LQEFAKEYDEKEGEMDDEYRELEKEYLPTISDPKLFCVKCK